MQDSTSNSLRAAGIRSTDFRRRVLACLQTSAAPRPLQELHAELGGDFATLCRTLHTFVAAGLAHRVSTDLRTWLYASGAAPNHDVHPHSVCTRCGKVKCLDAKLSPRHVIEQLHVPPSYIVSRCDVVLHGQCAACRA